MSPKYYAPRTCREFIQDDNEPEEHPLETLRDCSAYVLLGKPGMGKTAAFEQEAKQPDCAYITARDFITFDIRPDWRNKTLFIDGLDEVRATRHDAVSPFDEIRNKLDRLEHPRFRLSCREADWYGAGDREALKQVAPDRDIREVFLDELTDEDMRQLLIRNHGKTEAEASSFLEEAQRRELTDLIKNPQILEMLVVVIDTENEWPERKSDIFKLACEKLLLEEWNRTHNLAYLDQCPPSGQLMQTAGMLCAVMLLARKQGFAPLSADADEDHPPRNNMAVDHPEHLDLVSKTRLFTTHEGRTEYSHRIFAEFLSANYLSNKILMKRLPLGRVLALMTGEDGGVVADLRGVYAWLATLCHEHRDMLIQRDPLGVVLYGDVGLFSKAERLTLLHELSRRARETGNIGVAYWNTQSFGAFCQADMKQDFHNILTAADRSDRHQYLVEYVLIAMTHGKKLPELTSALTTLLRDDEWRYGNREIALHVLIQFDDEQVLRKILADVMQNIISDPDDDFLGMLLHSLYPTRITLDEIFNYLRSPKNSNYVGSYYQFWDFNLAAKANDSDVGELLDNLVKRRATLSQHPDDPVYREMIGKLLAKGVELFGNDIETEKLSDWLGLALNKHGLRPHWNHEGAEAIRNWLTQHSDVQKRLIEHRLDKCCDQEDFGRHIVTIRNWLFNADWPEDYGRWCLDKAKVSTDENIRRYYFRESASTLFAGQGNAGMSLELIENAAANDSQLQGYWDEYKVRTIPPVQSRAMQKVKDMRARQDRDKQALLRHIRDNLSEIEAGVASLDIFMNLGDAYFGRLVDAAGDTSRERLARFFQHDPDLVEPVLTGLQRFVHREDIPDVPDIFRLHLKGRYYIYSHPHRAGMTELGRQALELSEDKLAKALAFHFVHRTATKPSWYETILEKRPDLVAEVYIEYGTMALRAGKKPITGDYSLAFDERRRDLARLVALPLLKRFPVRCTSEQLTFLYYLSAAALQHADHKHFEQLIEKKLTLKSMNATQRVYWLAVGLLLDPDRYDRQLSEFVSGKETRIHYLSSFLSEDRWWQDWSPLDKLSLRASVCLTRLLGPYWVPYSYWGDNDIADSSGLVTGSIHYIRGSARSGNDIAGSSNLITTLIQRLATVATQQATDEIETLLESDELTKWRPLLTRTLHEQRARKREATFQFASLNEVIDTLKNGSPANAADLACITCERIRELADRIKHGNTNDYRQYWINDDNNNPPKRQHEETCRDRFLSDLKPLLGSMNIDAKPEVRYVAERRADIQVLFGSGYNIPIEIKCNDSSDLWSGIREQLIARYVIDPGTDGYGIYLVFWFGSEKTTPHSESGPKPRTPAELEERLRRLLRNDEERRKISVCVVDCTAP